MKYAVIAISGTQYKINQDQVLTVDKIDGDIGTKNTTDQVLLTVDEDKVNVGTPNVKGASVEYEIVKNYQGKKIDVQTYKAKSRYRRRLGFRPQLTDIKITKIVF